MTTNHYIENLIATFQLAQKWLKDRKDGELSYDDVLDYQKIIVALAETDGSKGRFIQLKLYK